MLEMKTEWFSLDFAFGVNSCPGTVYPQQERVRIGGF